MKWLLLALGALLPGCAGLARQETPPLPFHVALIPVRTAAVALRPPPPPLPPLDPEAPPREPPPPPLRLTIDGPLATAACAAALAQRCFVQVSALDYPEGVSAEQFAAERTPRQQEAWWIEQALARQADLVLRCEMRYDEVVESETNGLFVPNLVLFALGGPFCYFLDDRDYDVRAEFDCEFFDVAALSGARGAAPIAPQLDRRLALLDPRLKPRPCALDFVDRTAGASTSFYLASLLVPAGLLCQRAGQVREEVTAALVAQLCADLAEEIVAKRERLLAPATRAPFRLEPEVAFRARRTDAGQLEVAGEVLLSPRDGVDRLHAWSVAAGGALVRAPMPPPAVEGESLRYRLALQLPAPTDAAARTVQVVVTDATRDRFARTFTVPIEP